MNTQDLVDNYLKGLTAKLSEDDKHSLSYASGASDKDVKKLKKHFPACPDSLLQLLTRINGTYGEQYGKHNVSVLILGSDVFEYPYFLKSVDQIIEGSGMNGSIREMFDEYFDEIQEELVGKGVNPDINVSKWLCFSDCMNNGGTSQLFVDFDPAPEGVSGQVVRFLHDPDSFVVIANSFDEYLQMLMDGNYSFITDHEEEEDEDEDEE